MTTDNDERWLRDHQRKQITICAGWPDDNAPELVGRVHGLLGWLANDAGQVDISDWELGQLAGVADLEQVRTALATLVQGNMIEVTTVIGPSAPGIAPQMVMCPSCGTLLQSVHRRALELDLQSHLQQVHGIRDRVDLTTSLGKTLH